jgi:hypothetical protein
MSATHMSATLIVILTKGLKLEHLFSVTMPVSDEAKRGGFESAPSLSRTPAPSVHLSVCPHGVTDSGPQRVTDSGPQHVTDSGPHSVTSKQSNKKTKQQEKANSPRGGQRDARFNFLFFLSLSIVFKRAFIHTLV